MIVLAPGRFSISTGWPQSSLILWPMMRATMSLGPPAGNGTIIRIGRLGKLALPEPEMSWPCAAIDGQVESKVTIRVERKAGGIVAASKGTARFIASSRRLLVAGSAIVNAVVFAGNNFNRAFLSHSKC